MDMPANLKVARNAFTLVEMLVVIVIIGILVGLTAAALGPARVAVRNGVINAEIKQLDMALQNYRNEFGELPPTFIDVNREAERGAPAPDPFQLDARDAVIRHLRKAFPRYVPGALRGTYNPDSRLERDPFEEFANDVYYNYSGMIDPAQSDPDRPLAAFDAASALVFWLGGLPEQVPAAGGQWIPAGFHSDPQMPFKPGTPRTQPLFDFDAERIVAEEQHYSIPWDSSSPPARRFLRYYPDKVEAPYVYFKARRRGANWQYGAEPTPTGVVPYSYYHSLILDGNCGNICVPYRDPQSPPYWRNYDTYQIIAAGLDGQFAGPNEQLHIVGPTDLLSAGGIPEDHGGNARYRVTKTAVHFSDYDYDNLANFCEAAKLGDEIE